MVMDLFAIGALYGSDVPHVPEGEGAGEKYVALPPREYVRYDVKTGDREVVNFFPHRNTVSSHKIRSCLPVPDTCISGRWSSAFSTLCGGN